MRDIPYGRRTLLRSKGQTEKGMGQMIAALLILGTLKAIGKVDFPDFSKDIPKRVFPLPILYLCNMVSGLMSTQVNCENMIHN